MDHSTMWPSVLASLTASAMVSSQDGYSSQRIVLVSLRLKRKRTSGHGIIQNNMVSQALKSRRTVSASETARFGASSNSMDVEYGVNYEY